MAILAFTITLASQQVSADGSPPAPVPVSLKLCVSSLGAPWVAGEKSYPVADALVMRGQFKEAARAYYQIFRCDRFSPINPNVDDANELAPFDAALRLAANGNFASAVANLRKITSVLPDFGEARYLTGVFQWASGDHEGARVTWRATIKAPYFTQPPDTNEPPFVQVAARTMLTWSQRR